MNYCEPAPASRHFGSRQFGTDILGVDILGIDILGKDVWGVDISAPIRKNVLDIRNKEDYSVCLETVFISEELYMKILVVVVAAEE